MNNRHQDMDFLGKNRLVFLFQKNIVKSLARKDGGSVPRYGAWFSFAEKCHHQDNVEADFAEFSQDSRFDEPMRRLARTTLTEEDIHYIMEESELWTKVRKYERDNFEMGHREGKDDGIEIGIQKGRAEGFEEGRVVEKRALAVKLFGLGIASTVIAEITALGVAEIDALRLPSGGIAPPEA